ncbi:MAG: anhydro-N-acetylmuramic acid kinase [Candidatus Thioglobus sp.]|nr:MAG: anhydro-N-acetylmuramic acid kinase [Candidatus Thioglobus sp.]
MAKTYYIGLMSGTSMDGVDGVVMDNRCENAKATAFLPYPPELKTQLRQLAQRQTVSLKDLAQLDIAVAQLFAQTVAKLLKQKQISKNEVCAIGSHGQTIFHQGGVYSMQIGHGALIAEQTGITTVADFRMQDVAAGGQGAPLTPFYHRHLLAGKDGAIVNIGGIANITIIKNKQTIGFDTGPANTLMDCWINKHKNLDYDKDGLWARSGSVNEALLTALLTDDYFHKLPPKSTGTEYFNLEWLAQYLSGNERPEDVQRTLLELTVKSICANIPTGDKVYLCGGGARNLLLTERLKQQAPTSKIALTDDLGVAADFVEAAAFALFAKQTTNSATANIPAVTGAQGERILGAIYQI